MSLASIRSNPDHSSPLPARMVTLAELAREREARQRQPMSTSSAPTPVRRSSGAPLPLPNSNALLRAHRTVRLGRSIGLTLLAFCAFLALVGAYTSAAIFCLVGVSLARSGGPWLHNILPPMLHEGQAPTEAEVTAASRHGLFSTEVLSSPLACLALEWEMCLENLAFACTYGKRNCLTSQMYSGELSLGKVCRLVWGKLSEGVVRCY